MIRELLITQKLKIIILQKVFLLINRLELTNLFKMEYVRSVGHTLTEIKELEFQQEFILILINFNKWELSKIINRDRHQI
jgi:hypothetical protein